jgi:3-phenylpropionate/trans-cinnamate dioxygenase ferredoxin reductase subunit
MVSAAMAVNVWDVVDELKAIISAARPVDPLRLADASTTLEQLAGRG